MSLRRSIVLRGNLCRISCTKEIGNIPWCKWNLCDIAPKSTSKWPLLQNLLFPFNLCETYFGYLDNGCHGNQNISTVHTIPKRQWISIGDGIGRVGNCYDDPLLPWKLLCCHGNQKVPFVLKNSTNWQCSNPTNKALREGQGASIIKSCRLTGMPHNHLHWHNPFSSHGQPAHLGTASYQLYRNYLVHPNSPLYNVIFLGHMLPMPPCCIHSLHHMSCHIYTKKRTKM